MHLTKDVKNLLTIECVESQHDELLLNGSDHSLYLRLEFTHDDPCVALNEETAIELRDALTEWLEGCNHG